VRFQAACSSSPHTTFTGGLISTDPSERARALNLKSCAKCGKEFSKDEKKITRGHGQTLKRYHPECWESFFID
jgi:formylmethanofuran dehydrogenase subunit E